MVTQRSRVQDSRGAVVRASLCCTVHVAAAAARDRDRDAMRPSERAATAVAAPAHAPPTPPPCPAHRARVDIEIELQSVSKNFPPLSMSARFSLSLSSSGLVECFDYCLIAQ